MAIVKGLNEDAVIWKYTTIERRPRMEENNRYRYVRDERGNFVYDDVTVYHHIKLYSRRSRTNGMIIQSEIKPFFEKLKIRLIPSSHRTRNRYITRYRAVGCMNQTVSEEVYNNTPLHEVAQRYYDRINNQDLVQLMDTDSEMDLAVIDELKKLIEEIQELANATEAIEMTDEEARNTPNEPEFYEDLRYQALWTN